MQIEATILGNFLINGVYSREMKTVEIEGESRQVIDFELFELETESLKRTYTYDENGQNVSDEILNIE